MLDRDGNRIDAATRKTFRAAVQQPDSSRRRADRPLCPGPAGGSSRAGHRLGEAPVSEVRRDVHGVRRRSAKAGDLPVRGAAWASLTATICRSPRWPTTRSCCPSRPRRRWRPGCHWRLVRQCRPHGQQAARGTQQEIPAWQRWNDYGIGLLLKGKAELRQAAEAFSQVEKLGRYDGPLNLARVYYAEGRLDEAVDAVRKGLPLHDPPPPPWTVAWLSGLINRQQGHFGRGRAKLPQRAGRPQRGNARAALRFQPGLRGDQPSRRDALRPRQADPRPLPRRRPAGGCCEQSAQFQKTLSLDPENVNAHYNLSLLYGQLGDVERAAQHRNCTPATSPTTTPATGPSPRPERNTPPPTMRPSGLPSIPLQVLNPAIPALIEDDHDRTLADPHRRNRRRHAGRRGHRPGCPGLGNFGPGGLHRGLCGRLESGIARNQSRHTKRN